MIVSEYKPFAEITTAEVAQQSILVVDDDPVIRAVLRETLVNRGYVVEEAENAGEVHDRLSKQSNWNLIILDRRLPDCDGLVLLRTLRERTNTPVIILSILGDDHDRVLGLELGASDYLAKPVNLDELCIRIRNLLGLHTRQPQSSTRQIEFGDFVLNSDIRTLRNSEQATEWRLTAAESRMLEHLAKNSGQVFSRDQLTRTVFQRDWNPTDRSIDVLIARLRKLIEVNPRQPLWIVTMHGEGYRFNRSAQGHT